VIDPHTRHSGCLVQNRLPPFQQSSHEHQPPDMQRPCDTPTLGARWDRSPWLSRPAHPAEAQKCAAANRSSTFQSFSAVDRAPATMSAAASRVIGQKFTDFLVVRRTEGSKLPALVLRAHPPGAGYSLDTRGYQPAGYRLLRARGTPGNGVTNLSFSQQLLGNLHRRDSAASSFYWSDRREFCSLAFAPRRAEYSGLEPQNHFTRARTIHQSDFRDSRKPALRAF